MIRYSGENWEPYPPYISAGACATTLSMSDLDKFKAHQRTRHPIGFAPPVEPKPERAAPKPHIRPKLR